MSRHIWQVAPVFEPVLTTTARFIVLRGGRGSGKSWFAAMFALASGMDNPLLIVFAREFMDSLKDSSKQMLDNLIEDAELHAFYGSYGNEIRGVNGTRIVFKGLARHPQSIRSLEGADLVVIDEAQSVSRRSWDALRPTVRKEGAQIICCLNPTSDEDAVYSDLCVENRYPEQTLDVIANYDDNPWFPPSLEADRLQDEKVLDKGEVDHIWRGAVQFRSSELVIPPSAWSVMRMPEGHGGSVHFGLDLGFQRDPSAGVRVRMIERSIGLRTQLYIEREVVRKGLEYHDLENFLAPLGAQQGDTVVSDHQIPPGDMGEYRLRLARKGPGSVAAGIRRLLSCEIVVNPECQFVINELGRYRYKRDPATDKVMPNTFVPGNDHSIDATRYAIEDWDISRLRGGSELSSGFRGVG